MPFVFVSKDISGQSNAIVWSLTGIAIILVGLRLVARLHLSNGGGLDDIFIVWSLIIFVVSSAVFSWSTTQGVGKQFPHESFAQAIAASRAGIIQSTISVHSQAWPKLSIVALLCRLFNPRRSIVILFYTLVGFQIVFSCFLTIFNYVQCRPVQKSFNPFLPGSCLPFHYLYDSTIFLSAYSAFLDLLFAVYPVTLVWRLNMKRNMKVGFSLALGLGLAAMAAAIAKTITLAKVGKDLHISLLFAQIAERIAIEANMNFLAACTPTLGPFIRLVRGMTIVTKTGATAQSRSYARFGTPNDMDTPMKDLDMQKQPPAYAREEAHAWPLS